MVDCWAIPKVVARVARAWLTMVPSAYSAISNGTRGSGSPTTIGCSTGEGASTYQVAACHSPESRPVPSREESGFAHGGGRDCD